MIVKPDYNPDISKGQLKPLGLDDKGDILLYVIITLKQNLSESTGNFLGPIFINKKTMIGRQIVIDSDKYSVRELIIQS